MKELFLNRRFFMFLWGGVFALLLTFVFPRVYPWVIWALGCGGGLVVVDITLLYGFGKARDAAIPEQPDTIHPQERQNHVR